MTLTQRKKLAKAARELASEFAEGRGPKLRAMDYCGCAAGHVFRRAGLPLGHEGDNAADLDLDFGMVLTDATFAQLGGDMRLLGNVRFGPGPESGAVVFPLLWLADELESTP